MDCKKAQQQIELYLADELDTDELEAFMEHMDSCEDCRDELEIQFLVREGLARLEDGSTFDLGTELRSKVARTKKIITIIERFRLGIYILEVGAGMVLTACFLMLFIISSR